MSKVDWNEAPEWADQYVFSDATKKGYWASNARYTRVDNTELNTIWEFEETGGALCDFKFIEMRPQPEQPKEWEPTIGEECVVEYPYDDGCFKPFHGKKVTILGYCSDNDGEHVFTAHGNNGFIALYARGFRPLKTEKEKKREAFVQKGLEAYIDSESSIETPSLIIFLNDLFDALNNGAGD